MDVISRDAALSAGLKHYFTGVPCHRGHVDKRFVGGKGCFSCLYENTVRWQAANQEKLRSCRKTLYYANLKRNSDRRKAKYAADPEVGRASCKRWRQKNPDIDRERQRKWREENPEIMKACQDSWRAANPEKVRARNHINRARRIGAEGAFTPSEVRKLLEKQKGRCASCKRDIRRGFECDHILPVALGGSNRISNIQLLCRPCNRKKSAKHPLVWAREKGLLL